MSFKVICIREVKLNPDGLRPVVEIGKPYTVTAIVPCRCGCGQDYYVLAEDLPDNTYKASLFARTDGPDERERLEAWQEEQGVKYDRQFAEIIHEVENAI